MPRPSWPRLGLVDPREDRDTGPLAGVLHEVTPVAGPVADDTVDVVDVVDAVTGAGTSRPQVSQKPSSSMAFITVLFT